MLLTTTFFSKVRGVTMNNSDGESRQKIIKKYLHIGDRLKLLREPTNQFDNNAIAVLTQENRQIGYLSATIAEEYSYLIDKRQIILLGTVSDLTGGGILFNRIRGVNIKIDVLITDEKPAIKQRRKTKK